MCPSLATGAAKKPCLDRVKDAIAEPSSCTPHFTCRENQLRYNRAKKFPTSNKVVWLMPKTFMLETSILSYYTIHDYKHLALLGLNSVTNDLMHARQPSLCFLRKNLLPNLLVIARDAIPGNGSSSITKAELEIQEAVKDEQWFICQYSITTIMIRLTQTNFLWTVIEHQCLQSHSKEVRRV